MLEPDDTLLLARMEDDEGVVLRPYKDTVGKWSIGIGRNLDDVGITYEEARILYRNDMMRVLNDLRRFPWWFQLNMTQQRALANMRFNLGPGGFRGFRKMISALADGDYEQAAYEALDSKWAHQVGQRAHRIADGIRGVVA